MAQRSTLEERCLLIIRIALEEEQRLASDPGYQGMAANGAQPAELGGAQCSGVFLLKVLQSAGLKARQQCRAVLLLLWRPLLVCLGHLVALVVWRTDAPGRYEGPVPVYRATAASKTCIG